jgi:hypothetical protein
VPQKNFFLYCITDSPLVGLDVHFSFILYASPPVSSLRSTSAGPGTCLVTADDRAERSNGIMVLFC